MRKVSGSFQPLNPAADSADTYFEITIDSSAGLLYPLSNTGNIQYRINKSDWSNFNEANDHSYKAAAAWSENTRITIYHKGQLIYGTEPSNGTAARLAGERMGKNIPAENNDVTNESKDAVVIYPNPVVHTLNIRVRKLEAGATVTLFNGNGSMIRTYTLNNLNQTVSLKGIAAGVYYVEVKNGDVITTKKIIKQ